MKTASTLDTVESNFLEDLTEDYAGIWELSDMVASALETNEVVAVRESTMRLVSELVLAGHIRPGKPLGFDSSFAPWSISPNAAVRHIAEEYRHLGRHPGLGEITWFDITPTGEKRLREITETIPEPR